MTIDSTVAKIGRSMKKCEIMVAWESHWLLGHLLPLRAVTIPHPQFVAMRAGVARAAGLRRGSLAALCRAHRDGRQGLGHRHLAAGTDRPPESVIVAVKP